MSKPGDELLSCLKPYGHEQVDLFLAVRRWLLSHCEGANELIYDSYNAVSCAYSFSTELRDAFCHIAIYPNHVNLGFNRGVELEDPSGVLQGSGKSIRHISITQESEIETPEYSELVQLAVQQGQTLGDCGTISNQSILKSRSDKRKRPR